jgi:cysteine desulfurase
VSPTSSNRADVPVVYLDHAASTPVCPEAVAALTAVLVDHPGNPSGAHRLARDARRLVDDAREVVADAVGARPGDVVFTSGGTEADNLAVAGAPGVDDGVVVCSAVEHHAVLDPVVARGGGRHRLVGVDRRGVVDLDALAAALDESVALVSVMLVNNEVGVVQPLAEVAEVVRAHAPQALLHTDAVQALPWLDVAVAAAGADLISLSAHKVGGPKGVGALVVREGVRLRPQVLGGGQERERRPGTQNVPGIAAMAAAVEVTVRDRKAVVDRVAALRNRLADGLVAQVDGLVETGVVGGDRSGKVAGSCHVCVDGIESEALLFLLEDRGICASAASSCASGALEPSHVLTAMGLSPSLVAGSLRLSLGATSTDHDVDVALEAVPASVERLRLFS